MMGRFQQSSSSNEAATPITRSNLYPTNLEANFTAAAAEENIEPPPNNSSSNSSPPPTTSGFGLGCISHFGGRKILKANCEEPRYQLIYYDDPNELCERLYLLHSSRQAGNDSVNNKILSIESELRERGIIV